MTKFPNKAKSTLCPSLKIMSTLSLSLKLDDSLLHPKIIHRDMELVYEDVLHLNTHNSGEEEDMDFEASLWVHQNIIKLSKELWVCFQG